MPFAVFEKFASAYYTKLQEKSCYYFLIMYMKKHHMKSKQTKFWKRAHALFVICTRGTTLPQCYMRAHSFSANQERVIFFLPIIMQPIIYINNHRVKMTFTLLVAFASRLESQLHSNMSSWNWLKAFYSSESVKSINLWLIKQFHCLKTTCVLILSKYLPSQLNPLANGAGVFVRRVSDTSL